MFMGDLLHNDVSNEGPLTDSLPYTPPGLDDFEQSSGAAGIDYFAGAPSAFQNFLNILPVAVYACEGPSGVISLFNDHAVKLWGRRPKVGDTDERFCGSFRLWRPDGSFMPHDQTPMAVALREARSFRGEEVIIERPDGLRINVLVNIDPIFDDNGQVTGALNAFQDVTPLKRREEQQAILTAQIEKSEAALKDKEAELVLIAETTPLILTRCSRDMRYLFMNRAAADLFGRKPEEVIGKPILEVMGKDAFSVIKPHIEKVLGGEPVEFEAEMPYAGVGPRWVHVNYLPEWGGDGSVVGWVASIVDISKRKQAERNLRQLMETLEERVEERTREVRQLANELVNVEQSVRERVAHLLHDDLQQRLVAAKIQLSTMQLKGSDLDESMEVGEILDQSIYLTRNLAVELSPPVLENSGMQEMLAWLAQHMANTYQLKVDIEADEKPPAANREIQLLIYNVVRELLFNVVKHAGVQEATITVGEEEDGVTIRVSDQGVGFDPAILSGVIAGGFGLRNIRERLRFFGGRIEIDSHPDAGTRCTLFLPYLYK
jgi:two-component system CheB/CheR fusion protein